MNYFSYFISDLRINIRRLFIGQKLVLGNGAGPNGEFRSILSKYAATVPDIWGNYKNDRQVEHFVDSKRGRREMAGLKPGDTIAITMFLRMDKKNKSRPCGAFFTCHGHTYKYDIEYALRLQEVLLD
jgi:hypothetical protein